MGINTGMRGTDVRSFMRVARRYGVIILIRHTNGDSLRFVGVAGYYPKPAVVKAKTADFNPPARREFEGRRVVSVNYRIAGLVVHPGFQPEAYKAIKRPKTQSCWDDTMKTLAPWLKGRRVDLREPDTWAVWGVERRGVHARDWRWRVDVDPHSPRFGCIQLKRYGLEWSYIHGDYDLKDLIVVGYETLNERNEGTLDGVKNFTPRLPMGMEFAEIRDALNREVGVEMVQHGAEAQFAWHGEEPITVVYPDWRFEILADEVTVQGWYENMHRRILAAQGKDYLRDTGRIFAAGPGGVIYRPGELPREA